MALKLSKVKKEQLINEVIEQIKYDIAIGDVTAIDELLRFVPEINLVAYLPDDMEANARYNPNKEQSDPTETEIKEFLKEWGQSQSEITANLGYPRNHSESDELLMEDYFWLEGKKRWYPKTASMYSDRGQHIANYIRENAWKY